MFWPKKWGLFLQGRGPRPPGPRPWIRPWQDWGGGTTDRAESEIALNSKHENGILLWGVQGVNAPEAIRFSTKHWLNHSVLASFP